MTILSVDRDRRLAKKRPASGMPRRAAREQTHDEACEYRSTERGRRCLELFQASSPIEMPVQYARTRKERKGRIASQDRQGNCLQMDTYASACRLTLSLRRPAVKEGDPCHIAIHAGTAVVCEIRSYEAGGEHRNARHNRVPRSLKAWRHAHPNSRGRRKRCRPSGSAGQRLVTLASAPP